MQSDLFQIRFRFHRYPPCVLLGRGQDITRAADIDYCRRHGIDIARRVTGGGAVFMSSSILAWDVVVDRGIFGGDLNVLTRGICDGIAAGLSQLGSAARFRPPNDIEIGGRKISGTSGCAEGRSAILQGTVLVEDEVSVMARALRSSEAALRDKVTCLAMERGEAPPLSLVIESISRGLTGALRCKPAIGHPSLDEIAICEIMLNDETGTDRFLSVRDPPAEDRGMTRKLLVVLVNTDPRNPEELGAPFYHAAVAAAMDYEVDVVCAATAGKLMRKGVAEAIHIKQGREQDRLRLDSRRAQEWRSLLGLPREFRSFRHGGSRPDPASARV